MRTFAERMLAHSIGERLCAGTLVLALAACSSKQPGHHWHVHEGVESFTLEQRLSQVPRIVVDERAPELVRFEANVDSDYAARRKAASEGGTGTGGGAILTGGPDAVWCVLLLPLCVPVIIAGAITIDAVHGTRAAVDGARTGTSAVTEEQAALLAKAVANAELNQKFAAWADTRLGSAPRPTEYPSVRLRVIAIAMLPTQAGLTFRVAAEAQASPVAGKQWSPTVHYTMLPSRTASEWLGWGDDGSRLQHDLDSALKVLAYRILPTYVAEMPKPKRVNPWDTR